MNNKEKNLFFGSDNSDTEDDYEIGNNKNKRRSVVDYFSSDVIVIRLIFFVGILAVIFGIWKMAMQIKSPFIESGIVLEDKELVIQYLNRLKDSDGDGISDYEEEYVYGTSPYLIDTDSDGISDYDAIINMASQGTECTGDSCKIGNTEDIANLINNSSATTTQTFTIDDIRKALIDSGYSESMVNKLSDNDLQKIQEEIIKAANNPDYKFEDSGLESLGITEVPNISQEDLQDLENLSAEEIRQMMIDSGADVERLNQISDEDLKKIYLEALSETQINQ